MHALVRKRTALKLAAERRAELAALAESERATIAKVKAKLAAAGVARKAAMQKEFAWALEQLCEHAGSNTHISKHAAPTCHITHH